MSPTVLDLLGHYGIPFVALVVCAGELGVPTGVPSEILLLLAGSYAVHSVPGLIVAVLAVAIADIAGTTALHLAAAGRGARLLSRVFHHDPSQSGFVAWGRRRFGGHDAVWIFLGRLVPIIRMPVTVSSGVLRVGLRQFLIGAVPASLLWAGTPLAVGYFFQADVARIEARYAQFSRLLLLALPLLAVIALAAWWTRRGGSRASALRRGRAAVGLIAAGVAFVALAWIVRAFERSATEGVATLSGSTLVRQSALVGVLALGLLGLAGWDAAIDRRAHRPPPSDPGEAANALAPPALVSTAAWLLLVVLVGIGIALMARRDLGVSV